MVDSWFAVSAILVHRFTLAAARLMRLASLLIVSIVPLSFPPAATPFLLFSITIKVLTTFLCLNSTHLLSTSTLPLLVL